MKQVGVHYIWDVSNVDPTMISYEEDVKQVLSSLIGLTDLSVVGACYKQFQPTGVTGILLLSESHFSIHTWPEYGTACLDLFSCAPVADELIEDKIKEFWNGCKVISKCIARGAEVEAMPLNNDSRIRSHH